MSAPAVKPALPTAGAQAPKVGPGAPSATPSNPPTSVAGGPKVLPTTGSPNRPLAPPNANHATLAALPLSLVQEHKGGGGLNQQPPPINRTPEKPKENPVTTSMGIKPTSNGVEGSPNRPAPTTQTSVEAKKPDEGAVATAVMNHSAEIAATPPQPQTSLNSPLLIGTQSSPLKQQPTSVATGATNHSALLSVTSKLEGSAVEAKPSVSAGSMQPTEPPPATNTVSSTASTSPVMASIQQPQQQQPQTPVLTSQASAAAPQPQSTPPPPPPQQQQQQQQQHQQQQPPPQAIQQPPPPQTQQQPTPQPPQQPQQQQQPSAPQPTKVSPAPAPQPAPSQPPTQQQQQQPQQPLSQPTAAASTVPPQTQPSSTPQPQQIPSTVAAPVQPQTVTPTTQETPAKPTAVATEVAKTRTEAPKPEFKVATPPRNSKRKREVKPPVETPAAGAKTPSSSEQDDRKVKRTRTQTQPYQSPLPELPYIAKLKTLMKSPDDKLIAFYKNEFLAVRNAEGSFYICQAMQNIYKSSPRIRIRWLSQEKKDNKPTDVYIPDFYDSTDFDCILTNLELKRLDKNKFQLPEEERERTQSILKRALDVEKGVSEKPAVTEEHPDGLDLSLFRDESQLKKRRSLKRTTPRRKGKENTSGTEDGYEELTDDDESEEDEEEEEEEEEVVVKKKKPKQSKKVEKPKEKAKTKETKEKPVEKKAERVSERGRDRSLAAKRRSESTAAAATAAKNAAVKQTVAKHTVTKTPEKKPEKKVLVAKTPKKPEPVVESSIPTRSTKTRSVKVTSQPKSSPVTRTKERERRGAVPAKGKKKPGKKA